MRKITLGWKESSNRIITKGQFQRMIQEIENDSRDKFRGPDTTSLSVFLYSCFSISEAGGHGADDKLFRQRLDERRSENVANQIPQKETLDDIVRKKKSEANTLVLYR
ncbi:hypothetical protein O6H91_23G042700 [Diphasiastrum complanatum]|uniref:Uncharacterized protein n=1 Tax=Diphasiastrum complanatum TaxID=34168 RepID=A0ACC2AA03_DIPCM|nr:hypothetical protein O6H91_23G042700 [Diphasiastrum complanatum]